MKAKRTTRQPTGGPYPFPPAVAIVYGRSMAERWTAADIPDQTGRTAIVTGANSGLGLAAAEALAAAGAVDLEELAPSSLASVRAFAARFAGGRDGLDLLINNAGVMAPPRRRTGDGFALQFGTHHLGHFALPGLLLAEMQGREDARVVTVSSTAHKFGRIAFDNLGGERHYFRWRAYGQSKLANLLFARELDKRLRAAGSSVKSLAAHPGYAATNLQSAAPPLLDRTLMAVTNR